MNILFMSVCGESLCLRQKVKQEGHDAIWYIHNESSRRVGEGLAFQTTDPYEIADQADLIIFDDNGPAMARYADAFRAKGYAVWGGGSFATRLEHDRLFGMQVYSEYGIPIPETYEVKSLDEARDCLRAEFGRNEKLVIKLDGEEAAGSSFSFVGDSPKVVEEQVEHWERDGLLGGSWSGIIQRFISGIEVSTAAWWNGDTWSTHQLDLEEKKVLSGNLGQSVGCAFNTIVRISGESKLFKMVLEPIGPLLKKHGFIGEIDTNAIVAPDGTPYALEFTPRLGYDSSPTFAWGNNHGYINKLLYILGIGGEFEGFGYQGRVWAGVRVTIPPYPVELKQEDVSEKVYDSCKGTPILDFEKIEDDFYLYDAMRHEGNLVCAGTSGMVGVAMGAGSDPREAGMAAYRIADRLRVPNKQYRALDGWKRAADQLPELLAMKLFRFHDALPR